MRLFISHAAKDAGLAQSLRAQLKREKIEVLDPESDLVKGNIHLAIGRALERADAMVILLSPEALSSEWIRHELEYALGDQRFKGRLVPVLVRPTKDVPWILERLSVVDVTHDHPPRAVEKIVHALRPMGEAA